MSNSLITLWEEFCICTVQVWSISGEFPPGFDWLNFPGNVNGGGCDCFVGRLMKRGAFLWEPKAIVRLLWRFRIGLHEKDYENQEEMDSLGHYYGVAFK